jgi:hypothetical protein
MDGAATASFAHSPSTGLPTQQRMGKGIRTVIRGLIGAFLGATLFGFTACAPPLGAGGDDDPFAGQLVFSGLRSAILSVSGKSAGEVYAVGADLGDGNGPNFLAFDGQRWRRLSTGVEAGHLWWISVLPIDGSYYLAGDPGLILRFDPETATFERHDTPGAQAMFGVWGTAADDLWAVGGDVNDLSFGGVIWHYDGADWTSVDLSAVNPEGLPPLYKVWGRGASEIFVVGSRCTALRFDGHDWTKLNCDSTESLFTVHGNQESVFASGGTASGMIAEFTDMGLESELPAGLPKLNGVFVPASGRAVAVGNLATIVTRSPLGWVRLETRLQTTRDFHAVWVDPEGGAWAVGGNLTTDLNDGIIAYFGTRTITNEVSR